MTDVPVELESVGQDLTNGARLAQAEARKAEAEARLAEAQAKKGEAEALAAIAAQAKAESRQQRLSGILERGIGLLLVSIAAIDGVGLADFPLPDSQLVALIGIGAALVGRVPGTLSDLFKEGLT